MKKHQLLTICFSIVTIALIINFYSNEKVAPKTAIDPILLDHQKISDKKQSPNNTSASNKAALNESGSNNTQAHSITSEDNPQPLQTKTRPTWKLTGDIKAKLKALEQAAQTGDTIASYQLAMNYKYCFYAAINEQQLEEKLQNAYEFADNDKTIDNINHKYQYCKSVTKEQRQQYYQHLIDAAQNGEVAAKEAIGNITEHQYMKQINKEDLDRQAHIAKRDKFIRQQLGLLESAANQGSIKALMKLSNLQYSQNYGPNGRLKAFAYNQVILELTKDNQLHNRYSWYQQKMYDQLTPEELAQAEHISSLMLKNIQQNGTFYP